MYEPVPGEVYNGHPIFVKAGDPGKFLRYMPNHQWAVSPTPDKDANNNDGWAFSVEKHVVLPQDAKTWNVVGKDGKCVVQPDVCVTTVHVCVVRVSVCVCVCVCVCVPMVMYA